MKTTIYLLLLAIILSACESNEDEFIRVRPVVTSNYDMGPMIGYDLLNLNSEGDFDLKLFLYAFANTCLRNARNL